LKISNDKQEITRIFNKDDLILKFIDTYLKFIIKNKYESKYNFLKHIRNYKQQFEQSLQLPQNICESIDSGFIEYISNKLDENFSAEEIHYALYYSNQAGFSEKESKNLINLLELFISLIQNNPEGVHNFIIHDVKLNKNKSILHYLSFVLFNTGSEDLMLALASALK